MSTAIRPPTRDQLLQRIKTRLRLHALRLLRQFGRQMNEADIERDELVQEAWIKAFEFLREAEANDPIVFFTKANALEDSATAFAFTCMRNKIISHLRREKRSPLIVLADAEPDRSVNPEQKAIIIDRLNQINHASWSSPSRRAVFSAVCDNPTGTPKEIGEASGTSRKLVYEWRASMKRRFGDTD